ncbi:MAG: hypothetical protein ACKVS5_04870 [Parvularculaceae bacterium]
MRSIALFAVALLAASGARAGDATPLFASSDTLDITITGPIADIVKKAASSTDPLAATLAYAGDAMAIELSARGHARRRPENCKFPPLRVKFAEPPAQGSIFRKQKTLKLVTHCRAQASFQQHTLLEYAAYRMFNEVTEASFRVRLANVRYVDAKSGKTVAERAGFFVEDADDVADRVDLREVKAGKLSIAQHEASAAARAVLFFHMIANHDWSMLAGPEGDCCHNGKLLGAEKTAAAGLVFVPYDFDYSGFVDAPYAAPPDVLTIKSVRTRQYRGDCALNAEVAQTATIFRDRRQAIESAVRATPGLDAKTARKAIAFLDGFFADIASDAGVSKLLKRCR